VCLETRWLGQKPWFLLPGTLLYVCVCEGEYIHIYVRMYIITYIHEQIRKRTYMYIYHIAVFPVTYTRSSAGAGAYVSYKTPLYVLKHVNMYVNAYIYIHMYTNTCRMIEPYIYQYTQTYAYTLEYIHIYICVYIYTWIYSTHIPAA